VTDPLRQAKREARAAARARLGAVEPEEAARLSEGVCRNLLGFGPVMSARTLMVFLPLPGEPDVRPAARALLGMGRRVCLPRMDWEARTMTPAAVSSVDEGLVATRHGVREPGPGAPGVPVGELEVVLVPGLAFDESGRRVGRGAGFYDRFLSREDLSAMPVGVAFEVQLAPLIPAGPGDRPVRAIVTERRVIAGK
jgi:5-formyltetrahydrofolate cyclo-ligase